MDNSGNNHAVKPPLLFWFIASVAVIWNALGVVEYVRQMTMSASDFAALPQSQQEILSNQPFWLTAAFAIAVVSGLVGSLALIFRKKIAVRLFFLSFSAVIIQFGGLYLLKGYWSKLSGAEFIMPVLVPVLAAVFAFYSYHSEKARYLN